MCDEIRLVRHDLGETPWGFRITGGRDFGTPLLVVKVVGGSIAALAGVQVGDLIRGINYVPTNDFTHLDAQRAILESGDTLILNLLKGGEYEQYYQSASLSDLPLPEPIPPPTIPAIPVIDIQSPEDKEVEEIGGQKVNENIELSFLVHLDRSGRISAVEEIPTPCTTPQTTPTPGRSSSGGNRRKSSGSSPGKTQTGDESEKKPKVSVTVNDDRPITIQPPSYEEATKSKFGEKKESSEQQEVTLHEEMRIESTMKKTTTEIKERTEQEFIMGVRDEIISRAQKEKRELTEEEIAEMMAGEAEVIEASKGKEVIGVNFQKFMPKCEFIKDSEVFKVLQEEQIKKEKSEEDQLEKDPLKRFSKFLIKPKTAKPIQKPKPIHPELMPWQERLNSPSVPDKKTAITDSAASEKQKIELQKEHVKLQQESVEEEKRIEEQKYSEESENITVSTIHDKEDNMMIQIQKNEKQAYNEVIRKQEEEIEQREDYKAEEEPETIEWKEGKQEKRSDSDEISSLLKRRSFEEERRSKSKRVEFAGLQCKEDIEKQLAEIQRELLTLQRLPIEIQNHLLVVQESLLVILAQRNQIQPPENNEEKVPATEVYKYNNDGDDEGKEIVTNKDDKASECENEEEKESSDEYVVTAIQESNEKEVSTSKRITNTVEEMLTVSSIKSEKHELQSLSSLSVKEVTVEKSANKGPMKENHQAIKDPDSIDKIEEMDQKVEQKNDIPHEQEDVEYCEPKVKPALPLTPQMRPLVLPGDRKWVQPKDAYTEEYIAETLVSQSEVLVGTTIGVNFQKYIPPKFDTSNSAVYRLIHDIEERTKKGVAERPEKVYGLEEFYHPPIDKRHFYAAELAEKKHVDNLFQEASGPAHH